MKAKKPGLSQEPQKISEETWYYEEKGGLFVVHEVRMGGNFVCTRRFRLPWGKVLNSVKRFRQSKGSSKSSQ